MANNAKVAVTIEDSDILDLIRAQVKHVLRNDASIQQMIEEEVKEVIERKAESHMILTADRWIQATYTDHHIRDTIAKKATIEVNRRIKAILDENQTAIDAEAEKLKAQQKPTAEYFNGLETLP